MNNPFFFLMAAIRMQTIEFNVSATGNTKFPDQPQLDNTILFFIEAINAADVPVSPVAGTAVISAADFAKCNLMLQEEDKQKGQNIPLPVLHQLQTSTNVFTRNLPRWVGFIPSWTKCLFQVPNGTTITASTALFNVGYCMPEDIGFQNIQEYKQWVRGAARLYLAKQMN